MQSGNKVTALQDLERPVALTADSVLVWLVPYSRKPRLVRTPGGHNLCGLGPARSSVAMRQTTKPSRPNA
jgi:hypothetical protein